MNKLKKKTSNLPVKNEPDWDKIIKDNNEAIKEAKQFSKYLVPSFDADENLKGFARKVLPKINKGEKLDEIDNKLLREVSFILGVENGIPMMESVEERYRGMMFNLRKELIKEYDCKTFSEKALVDVIVGAYSRNLSLSRMLTHTATKRETTPNLNNYLATISKEIDRANRQFISALETLRQLKQPELKVNVRTKNAFIAQNQQFNNNQNETNNPK